MTSSQSRSPFGLLAISVLFSTLLHSHGSGTLQLSASELVVTLKNDSQVTFVGAFNRWNADGNHRRAVDPKAKIDKPVVDAAAKKLGSNRWRFSNLAAGRYDLVILTGERVRVEGFHYPPILEFDAAFRHGREVPASTVKRLAGDIAKSRHYENKVTPLYFAGNKKQVRVLVQLLRDKPTSFDAMFGKPVATLRHEVWQYSHRYGAWSKEKRTKVLDRVLMGKADLRRWTWIWEPSLGGIDITSQSAVITYELPRVFDAKKVRGLLPEK